MTVSCDTGVIDRPLSERPGARRKGPAPVILLGTDTPIGLAVARDLGRHGHAVIGIGRSATALAASSRHCTRHAVRAPDEAGLIEQIRTLAADYEAPCLLAIGEADLLMIDRNRAALASVVKPLVPDAGRLAQVLDKAVCQAHAEAVGIGTPKTWLPASLDEAEAAADALSYPVILKWADPNAVARALADAGLELHKTLFAENRDELLAHLSPYRAIGRFPMVQEYCPGHGVGHMFLAVDGEALIEFQHERLHEWPPEGGVSTLCRAVPLSEHAEAREKSRALLRRLRWTGVAMVEYRFDPATGAWAFMEINGRFWGSLPLAVAAGIPFAAGLVATLGDGEPAPGFVRDYPCLRCLFWIPETKRLLRLLFRPGAIGDPFFRYSRLGEVAAYFRYLLSPRTRFYIFSWNDPRPFLAETAALIGKILGKIVGS